MNSSPHPTVVRPARSRRNPTRGPRRPLHDAIIVGSGPAGTFAAMGLRGARVVMLDVGHLAPATSRMDASLIEYQREGTIDIEQILGREFESLHNIARPYLSPKLKAPGLRHIIEGWSQLSPATGYGYSPTVSHALGGFAGAWGGGVYRFDERDLEGFPFGVETLADYYDHISDHIGISGADDDASRWFGPASGCQPAIELSDVGKDLQRVYLAHRYRFRRSGVTIGAPRLALLTRDHAGRPATRYTGAGFFQAERPSLYHPTFTLRQLRREERLDYRPGCLVTAYRERTDRVDVTFRQVDTGAQHMESARRLILSAGTLNTARIVLRSTGISGARLPILDNAVSLLPILHPRRVGTPPQGRAHPIQAALVYAGALDPDPVQGTFYGLSGPLASDFGFDFPLSARANLALIRTILPALSTLQLFYSGHGSTSNFVQLDDDGCLTVRYRERSRGPLERHLARLFRRVGLWSLSGLCRYPPGGSSFHPAGCLPMRRDPVGPFETHPDGRLNETQRVYIADAANFAALPAKNLTLTIMANSMRIGAAVRRGLGR